MNPILKKLAQIAVSAASIPHASPGQVAAINQRLSQIGTAQRKTDGMNLALVRRSAGKLAGKGGRGRGRFGVDLLQKIIIEIVVSGGGALVSGMWDWLSDVGIGPDEDKRRQDEREHCEKTGEVGDCVDDACTAIEDVCTTAEVSAGIVLDLVSALLVFARITPMSALVSLVLSLVIEGLEIVLETVEDRNRCIDDSLGECEKRCHEVHTLTPDRTPDGVCPAPPTEPTCPADPTPPKCPEKPVCPEPPTQPVNPTPTTPVGPAPTDPTKPTTPPPPAEPTPNPEHVAGVAPRPPLDLGALATIASSLPPLVEAHGAINVTAPVNINANFNLNPGTVPAQFPMQFPAHYPAQVAVPECQVVSPPPAPQVPATPAPLPQPNVAEAVGAAVGVIAGELAKIGVECIAEAVHECVEHHVADAEIAAQCECECECECTCGHGGEHHDGKEAPPVPEPTPEPEPAPEPGPRLAEGTIPPPPELSEVKEPEPPAGKVAAMTHAAGAGAKPPAPSTQEVTPDLKPNNTTPESGSMIRKTSGW